MSSYIILSRGPHLLVEQPLDREVVPPWWVFLVLFVFCWDEVSLCRLGWPGTSRWFIGLCFMSAGIKGICYQTWPLIFSLKTVSLLADSAPCWPLWCGLLSVPSHTHLFILLVWVMFLLLWLVRLMWAAEKRWKEGKGDGGRDLRGKILPPVLSPKASSFLHAKNSHGKRKKFIFPTLRKDKCLQNDFNLASSLELVFKRIWWKINSLLNVVYIWLFFLKGVKDEF